MPTSCNMAGTPDLIIMVAKKSATLEFTRQYLRDKPEATFAEIRDAGAEQDMKIYPIVYGRAKALLGLVKVAPYGSRKKQREADRLARSAGTQPLATASASAEGSTALDNIEAMIQGVRDNHQDRERYRQALIRISEILDKVL